MPGENPLTPHELEKKITDAWENLLEKWFAVSVSIRNYDVSTTRKKWIIPLLEALDYNPQYLKKDTVVSEEKGVKAHLSHRGGTWDHAPIIHTVAPGQDLDEKSAKGRGVKSPHDSLQLYLNESKKDLWGVVTNGIVLRILRDYYHTYTKGYVEFDLEALFEMRSFSDFLALYRLVHPSRFVPDEEGISPLEHFYKTSLAAGEKIGDELRENVKKAIEVLGNGFLTKDLVDTMIKDPEKCKEYYREILHVIYRIIFLMFAEQRGMLPTRDSLYAEAYSMTKLREKAAKTKRRDRHCDLWKGLVVTFEIIKKGVEDPESKLTAYGYNGSLFDETEIKQLKDLDCENTNILEAIRYLTYFESEKTLQRISYVDLGVEEIGSIYESLLDYTPRIFDEDIVIDEKRYPAEKFFLDPRGAARKSTGSYYTHPGLINELIHSALKPVLEDRLAGKKSVEDKEKALLSIKVCDPACGSGAFLIAATNFLGKELAKIRTGTEYPPDKEERKAKRDVLQHCIYGADLNPMAVELAKVSLWINACVKDRPLNFLNHHIKCGNSLIGTTPELVEKGIPDKAFTPVTGDNKEYAKKVVKINRDQRKARTMEEEVKIERKERKYVLEYKELSDIQEERPEDVDRKKEKYDSIVHSPELHHGKMNANAWTAAFFWPLHSNGPRLPTEGVLRVIKKDEKGEAVDKQTLKKIEELKDEYRFFHWHLEFPDVFSGDDPGFDCVIGNPPWEKIKLQEKEFFSSLDSRIAEARTSAERRKFINQLLKDNHVIADAYQTALIKAEKVSQFARNCGQYPLCGKGDINTYALFVEMMRVVLCSTGYLGCIVPSGIATDASYEDFIRNVIELRSLVSLFDFTNRGYIFPGTESTVSFSLLTLSNSSTPEALFAAQLWYPDNLKEEGRVYCLNADEISMINPNTFNLPIFRSAQDASLIKSIYKRVPVLVEESTHEINLWGISFLGMFHMKNSSDLFRTQNQLENESWTLRGNIFCKDSEIFLPLYEAKLGHMYNHRAATFEKIPENVKYRTRARTSKTSQKHLKDPNWVSLPRYWISEENVNKRIPKNWDHDWFIGFRNAISAVADARSVIFTIIPKSGVGNSLPLIIPDCSSVLACLLVGNFNTFVLDYVAKQKASGGNLNFYIVKQLPILSPDRYSSEIIDLIAPKVIELTYTSWDLCSFAIDVLKEVGQAKWNHWFRDAPSYGELSQSHDPNIPKPFIWNRSRREHLRAKLDAVYYHLYGLSPEETDYILDTFVVFKRRDEEKYGEYRTKKLILKYYDEYADKIGEVKK